MSHETPHVEAIREALGANAHDAIAHALDHFTERARKHSDHAHHDKWIILSVHQAAECICNALLFGINRDRASAKRFPPLSVTIQELQEPTNATRLSGSERKLLALLAELPEIRNQLMHRIVPEQIDVSAAAMCMVALIRLTARRKARGQATRSFDPIEADVVEAIRGARLDEYTGFIETFVHEEYPEQFLPNCPGCDGATVVASRCQACFEEIGQMSCPECDEDIYYLDWMSRYGKHTTTCGGCGREWPIR